MSSKHALDPPVKHEADSKRCKIKQEDSGGSTRNLSGIPPAPAPFVPKKEVKEDIKFNIGAIPIYSNTLSSKKNKNRRRGGPPTLRVNMPDGWTCRVHYDSLHSRVLLDVGSLSDEQFDQIILRLGTIRHRLQKPTVWGVYSVRSSKIRTLDCAVDVEEYLPKYDDLKVEPSKPSTTMAKPEFSLFPANSLIPFQNAVTQPQPSTTTSTTVPNRTLRTREELKITDSLESEEIKPCGAPDSAVPTIETPHVDSTEQS